jgi:hypothetical protein
MAKAYYWTGKKNFGDLLTPLLFKKFSNLPVGLAPIGDADLVAVGSILDLLPQKWRGMVVGTGKLREAAPVDLSAARVMALRGPLTAASVTGLRGDVVYGDLGLLADELVPRPAKLHQLGIVPHWSDTKLEQRPEFLKYKPLIIRPSGDPLDVITQIGSCRKIVSSSLHGLILADAFGIPRRTELAERQAKEGGAFKFQDYSASLDLPFEIGLTQTPSYRTVVARQHELYDVLMYVAGELAVR